MTEQQILKRIYPSVVTFMSDWRSMLKDVKHFGLTDISLFLTGVGPTERREIYQQLQLTSVNTIPHVHARNDMTEAELDWLVKKYKTKAFTVHFKYFKFFIRSKHVKKMFVENNFGVNRITEFSVLKKGGGICLDLSHVVDYAIYQPRAAATTTEAVKHFKIGCNHLSAVKADGKSWHYAKTKSELAYVTELPKKYFSNYINLELANSIPQQLEFRDYLARILAKQWNKKF
ncbi:MAG: hypothetical protein PHW95_00800 [Patescibacteria group bacterium]|nr:hypothetical protein [Patescibacteria group bacterium]